MRFSLIRKMVEAAIVIMLMFLLWKLGIQVGFAGGQSLNFAILPEPKALLQVLCAAIEFLVSITFFIILGRQILPSGIKELVVGPMTLANKLQYFPGVFALGVFAGLTLHAVVVFMTLLSYGVNYVK